MSKLQSRFVVIYDSRRKIICKKRTYDSLAIGRLVAEVV